MKYYFVYDMNSVMIEKQIFIDFKYFFHIFAYYNIINDVNKFVMD